MTQPLSVYEKQALLKRFDLSDLSASDQQAFHSLLFDYLNEFPVMNEIAREVILANKTEDDAASIIVGEILWCASSIAKSMPEIGAPVATEKPAQAPPVIEYLSHALCFPLVNT